MGLPHDISEEAAAVLAAPEKDRARLAEAFLSGHDALWRAIVKRYIRSSGLPQSDFDDAVQAVRLEVYDLLQQGPPPGVTWGQALWQRAQTAMKALAASGATTGFAGMTGLVRRRRSLETMRDRTGLSGRQLVEAWNAETSKTRSDAVRQGAVASEDDLVDRKMIPDENPLSWSVGHLDVTYDDVIGAAVTTRMVALISSVCAKEDKLAGQIAEIWLTSSAMGEPVSCAEIARRISVPGKKPVHRAKVLSLMPRVREIAREVACEQLVEA